MAQQFQDTSADTAAVRAGLPRILVGWTVYDALDRPVGNFTDFEGTELRIDGRPEGRGFFTVPARAVRVAEEGSVYLNVEIPAVSVADTAAVPGGTPTTLPPPHERLDERSDRSTSSRFREPGGTSRGSEGSTMTDPPLTGSSFTASDTPVGLGSNTPVGAEPGRFSAWDRQVEGSSMNRAAAWLAPVVIGAASAGAYAYWRQRQARRSRMRRLSRAFASAGATVTPLLEAARTDKRLWGIAPLAAGAAAAYLRAARRGDGPEQRVMDAARAASSARWRDLDFRELLATAALPEMEAIESPPRWTLAIPVIGAGFVAAWFGAGAMRRRKSRRVRLGDIMTRNVQTVRPEASVFEASTLMQRLGVGFLPVCDGRRLHGVLTDRDVVVRSVAASRDAQLAIVRDAMSPEVVYAFEDDGVDRGAALMRKHQIRRLPIVDQQKNLVGVVSLGDLAVDTGRDRLAGATLERISEPARPTR